MLVAAVNGCFAAFGAAHPPFIYPASTAGVVSSGRRWVVTCIVQALLLLHMIQLLLGHGDSLSVADKSAHHSHPPTHPPLPAAALATASYNPAGDTALQVALWRLAMAALGVGITIFTTSLVIPVTGR